MQPKKTLESTHKEECIGKESIDEDDHPQRAFEANEASGNCQDDANKLVSGKREDIHELVWPLDVEDVASEFDEKEVKESDKDCARGRFSKNLGSEGIVEAGVETAQKNVRDHGHN